MKALKERAPGWKVSKQEPTEKPNNLVKSIQPNIPNKIYVINKNNLGYSKNKFVVGFQLDSYKQKVIEEFKFMEKTNFINKNPSEKQIFDRFSYFKGMPFVENYNGIKIYYYNARRWSSYSSIFDDNNIMYINANKLPQEEEYFINRSHMLFSSFLFFPVIIGFEKENDFYLFN